MRKRKSILPLLVAAFCTSLLVHGTPALAHCDGLDGPVVTAAKKALDTNNINHVLIWVAKKDEAEVRSAFAETKAVRKLGDEARALADKYFFETVVRVHRAAEGAPYTGLKPAGRDLGPVIPAADEALRTGSEQALAKLLTDMVRDGLHDRFEAANGRKAFAPDNVTAGRAFVHAYVKYIHYAERLHGAVSRTPEGHYPDAPEERH